MSLAIHRKLKAARYKAGLTLRAAAKLAGLDNAHISMIENGRVQSPKLDTVKRLCAVYGIHIEDL